MTVVTGGIPLHALDATPGLPVRIAMFAAAGLVAALVMNVPMARLSEGQTPPFVAASALTGETPSAVSSGVATAVHYAAGALGGVLFALVADALGRSAVGLPRDPHLPGTALPVVPGLLAAVVVLAVLIGVFSWAVLPRFGDAARERADRIRRDWAVSAAVYTVALVVVGTVLVAAVG